MSAGSKILALAASLLCGCTTVYYQGSLELVAMEAPAAATKRVGELAVSELCPAQHAILSELVERALAQYPDAQALADVKITVESDCSRLEGVPVRRTGPTGSRDPSEEVEPRPSAREQQ